MRTNGRRQHRENIRVRKKCQCIVIEKRHFGTEHQWRAEETPECHHRFLLIRGKIRMMFCSKTFSEFAKRQHITVRITAGRDVALPELATLEHIL